MPNYKTHDLACYTTAPILSVASLAYLQPKESLLFGAGVIITNHFLSPDLDIDSIMNRRWGILSFLWIPYKNVFHHRSFWTHSSIISATIRLLYLLLVLSPLLFFISYHDVMYYARLYQREIIILYLACVVSDTLHTVLDFISYATKIPFGFWKNTRRSYRKA